MLKLRFFIAATVVCSIGLSVLPVDAPAGLFDKIKLRKQAEKSSMVRRAQSPPLDPANAPPSGYAPPENSPTENYSVDTAWYNSGGGSYDDCWQCGPEDKHCWIKIHRRKICDQTYYCPVPPYCYACFGHYPTCWTRMQECQLCPRVEYSWHPDQRRGKPAGQRGVNGEVPPPAPPASPDLLTPPAAEPPPDLVPGSTRRDRGQMAPARVGLQQQAVQARPSWTGYADTIIEEEISAAPVDTLEEQIAAEDDASYEGIEFVPLEDENFDAAERGRAVVE